MEIKQIVEGMTAPQVAQVIDENFNGLNTEKANKAETEKKLSELGSKLIKLTGFGISQSDGNAINVGDIYYNTNNKKLTKKTGGTAEVIPFIDGAIYSCYDILYVWNGNEMIFADQNTWLGYKNFKTEVKVSASKQNIFKTIVQNSSDTYFIQLIETSASFNDENIVGVQIGTVDYSMEKVADGLFKKTIENSVVGDTLNFYVRPNKVSSEGNCVFKIKFGFSTEIQNLHNALDSCETDIEELKEAISDIQESSTVTEEAEITDKYSSGGDYYVYPIQTVGQPVVFGEFGRHYVYDIPKNTIVKLTVKNEGSYGYALVDKDGNVIDVHNSTDGSYYEFNNTKEKCYLYASVDKLVSVVLNIEKAKTEAIEDKIIELENSMSNPNFWKNKTIWWCGTSIPAGSDATLGSGETIAGNYPKQVGRLLECNVINKAVGGSMCRANVRTGDYVDAMYENITSALAMTNEEAENFISNYESIKGRLRSGAPNTLTETYKNRLRAASFENRLLPYLDGTYPMPDLFVFDHGHNDFKYTLSDGTTDIGLNPSTANISSGELAEDIYMTSNNNAKLEEYYGSLDNVPYKASFIASVNRNCYFGAINFLITLILRYNPHARIVFISNYEYEHGEFSSYAPLIPAQEGLADSWAFPLCKIWKYLGYSNHVIPNSKDWFNRTYPNVSQVTKDVTVFRAYNPDYTHPHSDTTGDANNIYAGVISEFIKTCR